MDTTKLKTIAREKFHRLQTSLGTPFLILICSVIVLLSVIGIQKYFDHIAEAREEARFAAYEREAEAKLKVFQSFLQMANKDHETTTQILASMETITRNINQLAENDRRLDERVSKISEGEYRNARNQKNNQKAVANRTARSSVPVSRRVDDALAADRELYPD